MKFLLDTHVLLWAAGFPERLSPSARELINDEANDLVFSAASLWEIVIKNALGREDFAVDARVLRRALIDNGYLELAVTGEHVVATSQLPPIHKDPFDRMLIAQSIAQGITLLTADQTVQQYSGPIRKI